MPELTDLSYVRALCEKYDFALSKGFGQNFIINPGLPIKIVDASRVDKRYGVIEIGPGIGVLTREYGFSDENLEKFAELLFDFAAASPDRDATVRLACGITAIYRYLDEKKALVSLNRYYILKELENMTAR